MLSKKQIEQAKKNIPLLDPHHEHDDCIRMAYEWLDAQKKTKFPRYVPRPLKHIIEKWAGRYVSRSDVEIAAYLHPSIIGRYPYYNISSRLTEPSIDRLKNIEEAFKHGYREEHNPKTYKIHE